MEEDNYYLKVKEEMGVYNQVGGGWLVIVEPFLEAESYDTAEYEA